jgi:hypothetical protein
MSVADYLHLLVFDDAGEMVSSVDRSCPIHLSHIGYRWDVMGVFPIGYLETRNGNERFGPFLVICHADSVFPIGCSFSSLNVGVRISKVK